MMGSISPQMQPFEILYTDKKIAVCDGGKGAAGHPRVFLNMGELDFTDCPYCSRRFVLKTVDEAQVSGVGTSPGLLQVPHL